MARASGSRVELAYKAEVTPGETPVPLESGWSAIRKNSESLQGPSDALESGEIRADRQNASDVQGNKNVNGDIVTELSAFSHDALIASAMFDAWNDITTGTASLDTTASGNTIDRAAGSFVTDGFVVGQWVKLSGTTGGANDGFYKVTAVSSTQLTVSGATLTDSTGSGDEVCAGSYLIGGVDPQYLSIRKAYRDIDKATIFDGCLVATMGLSMAPNSIVGVNFTVNGREETLRTGTGASGAGTVATDVSTDNPMDSFSGAVTIDDVVNNNMTQVNFALENNIDDLFVVGSRFKVDQSPGRQNVNGQVGFYFEDLAEYENSINHTAQDVGISTGDGSNYFGITLPRAYFDLPTPPATGEGEISMSGPLRARYDETMGATIIISRSRTS